MPKDPTKNVDRYKVRGGALNEFEFHQKATKNAKAKKTVVTRGASAKTLAARKAAKK